MTNPPNSTPSVIKQTHYSKFVWIFPACSLLLVLSGLLGWRSLVSEIEESAGKTKATLDTLKNAVYQYGFSPTTRVLTKKDSVTYLLKESDLRNYEQYINYLVKQTDKTADLYLAQIQADIDRLNLFLTLGIGLLGILGTLIPFAANFIAREEFKEKIDRLQKKMEAAGEKAETIEKKVNDADEKSKKIDPLVASVSELDKKITVMEPKVNDIDSKANEAIPKVSVLTFQNVIQRLFNLTLLQHLPDNVVPKSRESFKQIKRSLEECRARDILPMSDNLLKLVLTDLATFLSTDTFQFRDSFDRSIPKLFGTLSEKLVQLAHCNNGGQMVNQYKESIDAVEAVIKALNSTS